MKQLNWYQIFGNAHKIPDGRTVTPTDDIQIWLHCADIWDKAYTTLAEVLADTDTLLALITSNNAVDYMVRSTTWAVPITVPIMTSATTPEGEVFASAYYPGEDPYRVFDGDPTKAWTIGSPTRVGWIGYRFTSPVVIQKFTLQNRDENTYYICSPKTFTFEGSNDGVTYTTLGNYTNTNNTRAYIGTYNVTNTTAYEYYRINITDVNQAEGGISAGEIQYYSPSITTDADAMTYIGQNNYCANTLLADATWCNAICNSTYWQSVLNAEVPAMTSNTTPSGTASTDSIYNTNYDAWKAFNGIDNINYGWCPADSGSHWVQYDFETPVCVKKIQYRGFNYGTGVNAVLRGSTDNVTFTDIFNIPNPGSATSDIMSADIFSNNDKYRYIRVNHVGSNGSGYRFQFYGRKDV